MTNTVQRLKETSPMDRRRDRTRWVEVLNCCTAWIPLRKDPHGPEAYGTSGSITLPQPKAARDHCTPAHRTSYQVGRVRLSPPASPQPIAPPKLQPRSQASTEKPGLKTLSQDFKREALALDKERQQGYCLIPDPVQHEKIRRRMPPWSPERLLSQASSRASSITRTLTFCNTRQRKISLSPALPGLACRGRMPRFLPARSQICSEPYAPSKARRIANGQQKPDRRIAPPCRGCKPRSHVPSLFTLDS